MWTGYPKTTFRWSPDTELERVVFTANVIAEGFYQRKKFTVLPRLERVGDPSLVVLPELPYCQIPSFWKGVGVLKRQIPLDMPKEWRGILGNWLGGKLAIKPDIITKREREWVVVEKAFWRATSWLMPRLGILIGEVEVRLTSFGTISSASVLTGRKQQKLVTYLREDATLGHLAEIILTALMIILKKKYWFSWGEVEATVDFLMRESQLKKLFPAYQPTVRGLVKPRYQDLRRTTEYLSRLRVPIKAAEIEMKQGKVWVLGKSVGGSFSAREMEILKLLVVNQGEVVSFDLVADSLWGEGEFVSLWALNKAVQRLRQKLVKMGLNQKIITTVRKRGYVLMGGN